MNTSSFFTLLRPVKFSLNLVAKKVILNDSVGKVRDLTNCSDLVLTTQNKLLAFKDLI